MSDSNVSSRTPEGLPSRCPICGADTDLEFSQPSGDAVCPNCGHLLWISTKVVSRLRQFVTGELGVPVEEVSAKAILAELQADSLDVVELVMECEDEFNITIPDDDYERLRTVGDVIRYIEEQHPERGDAK